MRCTPGGQTLNLKGDIPYATGNVMSVRHEPGAGRGGEQIEAVTPLALTQGQAPDTKVFIL
jgi:hypothetical protein